MNLYIDGVGQKGYVRSGVSGQAGDTQGNPFPQLAIGEYKVITSNYKAEYDQISSAAITALSRSGTNEFSGEAFGTYSADNWRASTPAELDSGGQGRVREQGIRRRVRGADHRGPAAFLRDLRRQALRDSGERADGIRAGRRRLATARRRARAARSHVHRFRGRPVLRKTRLGALRARQHAALGKDPR